MQGRDYVVINSAYREYFDDKDNELKIYFGSLLDNKDEISARIAGRTLAYLKVRMKSEKEYGDLRISEKLKSIIKTAEEKMNED